MEPRPFYAVLDVPTDASPETIKLAYRRLALKHHPDRSGSSGNDSFARIAAAYEVLGHPSRRKRYDLTGEVPQNDVATGRVASETFLSEYVRVAPKVAGGSQADMSLHNFNNYEVLEIESSDVPGYMRDIVSKGLGYLITVVDNMEDKEVVLLRHYMVDQMYALLAYCPPLDAKAFEDRGYIITYYDDPLQAGIKASWSDPNRLDGSHREHSEMKEIDEATIERRRLVAIEWSGAPQPEKEAPREVLQVPGEGCGPERLRLGVRALLAREKNVGSFGSKRLRRELEQILCLESEALDALPPGSLISIVFETMDEVESEGVREN